MSEILDFVGATIGYLMLGIVTAVILTALVYRIKNGSLS